MAFINKLDNEDTQLMIFTVVIPVIAWWVLSGRKKYSTKGMNNG